MFLFAAMGMVWSTELLNTAIEKLSDRITQSEDQIIRDVKDIAAGAVLFAVFSAIAIGLVIFVPKAVEKLGF
jgi:diacylglycerol kinase (ATP)